MLTETMNIDIERVAQSRLPEIDFNNLPFGRVFSDHLFVANFEDGEWKTPRIVPYEKMQITPACSALHYGQSVFEGMKAYRNKQDGSVSVFRPMDNFKRMNISAERMAMPQIPEELFMHGLTELLRIDKEWVPNIDGGALYIRPLLFATDEYIGVKPSENYRLIIFTVPVGAYYSAPVKVLVERNFVRAAEGGTGYTKTSGNYARSLYPSKLAQQKGYNQLIWTDAKEHKYVEESGTMNLLFVIGDTLVTPPVGPTILNGITRDSVVTLARDAGMKVEERKITIEEIIQAHNEGKLNEAFGAGTAATIAQIVTIGIDGKDYELPAVEERTVSNSIAQRLSAIKTGMEADKFGWNFPIV